mgnify:CR=1 FL=1
MYLDDALLYNQGYMISINDLDSPLFYLFDYDSRSFKINMSFQHFHQFYDFQCDEHLELYLLIYPYNIDKYVRL